MKRDLFCSLSKYCNRSRSSWKSQNFSFVLFTINQIRMHLITSMLEIRRGTTFFCFDLRDDLRRLRLKTSSSVLVEKIYMMEYVPIVSKRPIWKKNPPKHRYKFTGISSLSVADLLSKILDAPLRGPNSFNFMQFLGKFGKIVCWRPPPGELAPLPGEILDPPLTMYNHKP